MISVVLPCVNELRHGYLPKIIENLQAQQGDQELIAVVSASSDETLAVLQAAPHFRVIESEATNRAQRLNVGIQASQGEVVLLHHPATLLPPETALRQVAQAFQDPTVMWSGFRHQFDLSHWLLRYTSWYSSVVRPRWGQILYLDHCVAVRRSLLQTIGGVPDLDIFEDTVLSQRLKEYGPPKILPGTVVTSARRYRDRGVLRQALMNQSLKVMYHLQLDPRWMNRLYERKAQINVTYADDEIRPKSK
ncbi:glycosyltransferase [Leptolyngbya iicbica]|uniref:4,4'-diaponeurosporenoate glycosyltransferase n=2 Tax=Cyanophyceae TaxID=3028117 RepID=A0A4Q7E6K9_9CYAN|nr:glycosyltransferase [Leptolyngbya sp. LK]RZM77878.1 glycosyltransferase [Leptolyngbya sp. LK]